MGIAWPSTLPTCISGYTEKAEPITVRSNVEEGPPKVRRRFTKRVVRGQVSITMTIAQRNRLDDYFYIDLDGGVIRFNFRHPWTGVNMEWRMVEAPDFQNQGPLAVDTRMVWEIMGIAP